MYKDPEREREREESLTGGRHEAREKRRTKCQPSFWIIIVNIFVLFVIGDRKWKHFEPK